MRQVAVSSGSGFDWRFVAGSLLLFMCVALLPVAPLLSRVFNPVAGLKLFVMLLEALFVIFVLMSYSSHRIRLTLNRYSLLLFLWLFWVFLATILSEYVAAALVRFSETAWHLLFAYALFMFLSKTPSVRVLLRNFIAVGFVIYAILIGWFLFSVELGIDIQYPRVFLGFHHMRNFGHYALISLFVILELLKDSQMRGRKVHESIYFISAVIAWIYLFVLGGRGPFFAFVLAAVVVLLVRRDYFTRRYVSVVTVSVVLGLLLSLPASHESFGVKRLFATAASSETVNELSSGRIDIWRNTLQQTLKSPFFGEGPEGYLFSVSQQYPTTIQPHGLLAQIVIEWGLPGAILFLLLVLSVIVWVIRQIGAGARGNHAVVGGFATVMAILSFSLVDGVLYHPRTTFLFAMVLMILLAEIFADKSVTVRGGYQRLLPPLAAVPLITVSVLHAISLAAVLQTKAPGINDASMQSVRFFPSVLADPGLDTRIANWSHVWTERESGADLSHWYQWLEKNSSRPWLFAYLNAMQLHGSGKKALAEEAFAPYVGFSPLSIQEAYDCAVNR